MDIFFRTPVYYLLFIFFEFPRQSGIPPLFGVVLLKFLCQNLARILVPSKFRNIILYSNFQSNL